MPVKRGDTVYLTLNEVAEQVQCSRISIWRWRKEGKIPLGQRYRDKELLFTRQEVEAVFAHAHRLSSDEVSIEFEKQLKLLF